MSNEQLLALDQGTQGVRALVFDPAGNVIARSQVPIEPYFTAEPGWAEQHPAAYWEALCRACQALWAQPGVDRAALKGAALTAQRGTVVNLDARGEPLRPAITWLDRRRTLGLPPVGGAWGALFRLLGLRETVAYFQAEAEANWIRTHQPDVWAATHKLLLLSGYLIYRLSGRFADSTGAQVAYLPFDYRRGRWAHAADWKWLAVPVGRDALPDLVRPTEQLGEISAEAAAATGIPAGLPLIAAASDKACEALGAGCFEPHIACLSYGTSASVIVSRRRYREVRPMIPPYPAAVPGAYNLEVQLYRGYWLVEWFKQEFGHPERVLAHERDAQPEALLDELAGEVPPGSLGLTLLPYWSPGLKVPGPEAKGAVIGFGEAHTRAHLYRALLEGVAYAMREGKEQIERRTGTPVRELRVAGGGSRSAAAMQLTADIFGMPAVRPHVPEASALGAAIDAAVGLGLHPDVLAAARAMTRPGDSFAPNPEASTLYDALYRRVYLKLYARLKPLYDEIAAIAGYPAKLP
jgi:sugar (pentulose or hexulose) kinase